MSETNRVPFPTGLTLDSPLVILDLETTGLDQLTDRIVQIGVVKLYPDGTRTTYRTNVNPGMAIPLEATAVHGLREEDVKGAPRFSEIAASIAKGLLGCAISGFNISFDLGILVSEFSRCSVPFNRADHPVFDVFRLFVLMEPRTLDAARKLYGVPIRTTPDGRLAPHDALADAEDTASILEKMLPRYDLPRTVPLLVDLCNAPPQGFLDPDRKIAWKNGEATIVFGTKVNGKTLRWVATNERGFLEWCIGKDFNEPLKRIFREALAGRFPTPDGKKTA